MEILKSPPRIHRVWYFVVRTRRTTDARRDRDTARINQSRPRCDGRQRLSATQPSRGRPTGVIDLDRSSGAHRPRRAGGGSPWRATPGGFDPEIRSTRLRRLHRMWVARENGPPPSWDRSWAEHRAISLTLELAARPRNDSARV